VKRHVGKIQNPNPLFPLHEIIIILSLILIEKMDKIISYMNGDYGKENSNKQIKRVE